MRRSIRRSLRSCRIHIALTCRHTKKGPFETYLRRHNRCDLHSLVPSGSICGISLITESLDIATCTQSPMCATLIETYALLWIIAVLGVSYSSLCTCFGLDKIVSFQYELNILLKKL
jgi:hypothetical protein